MANKKISELPAATVPLSGPELMEIVQGGINKKVAKSDVAGNGFVTQVLTADVDITGAQAVRFGTAASHLSTFEVHTTTSMVLHAQDQLIVDVHDDINPNLVTSIVASPTAFVVAGYNDGGITPNASVQVNGGTGSVGVSIDTAAASGNSIAITSDSDISITGDSVIITNAATVITDAASMAIIAAKNTLTTSSATRTFTITYTGDDITIEVTLNTTSSVFTFPVTSLCVSNGVASGDNTCSLSGLSGDKYIFAIKKIGSAYYVVAKNFGQ